MRGYKFVPRWHFFFKKIILHVIIIALQHKHDVCEGPSMEGLKMDIRRSYGVCVF